MKVKNKTHEKLLAQQFIRFISGWDTPLNSLKVYHILPEIAIDNLYKMSIDNYVICSNTSRKDRYA